MKTLFACVLAVCAGVLASGFADDKARPALLLSLEERLGTLTAGASKRVDVLAAENERELIRLAARGEILPDPALRLWAERDLRLLPEQPFGNLYRPKGLTGYPAELETWSLKLREDLQSLLTQMKEQKKKVEEEAAKAFEERVRSLVRANDAETAHREREQFRTFGTSKAIKGFGQEIQRVEKLLSGKGKKSKPATPADEDIPAPPDALFLFEPDNPAFQVFLGQVKAVSAGSPERGASGVQVGQQIRMTGQRGLSMLALVGKDVVVRETYDTYESKEESLRFSEAVQALPYGAFVVLFAHDDATRRFSGEAQSSLFRLGASRGIDKLPYRSAYLLIGVKGMRIGGAVERSDAKEVTYP
jgi:hypothetical protein